MNKINLLALLLILSSCGSNQFDDVEKDDSTNNPGQISLSDIDTNLNYDWSNMGNDSVYVEFLSLMDSGINKIENYPDPGRKDKIWKIWLKMYRSCMTSSLNGKEVVYLGSANKQLNIGDVVQYVPESNRFDASFAFDLSKFNKEEQRTIAGPNGFKGNPTMCANKSSIKTDGKFLAQLNITNASIDAGLTSQLVNSKDIVVTIDQFVDYSLYKDGYLLVLNQSKSKYAKNYLEVLKKDNRYCLNRVIKAKGFSATIKTSTKIDGDLKGKLQNGALNIAAGDGDGKVEIEFSYQGDHEITMKSKGEFIVFGMISTLK